MLLLLTALALAAPTLGEGPQSLTVVVTNVPGGMRIEAEREGVGALVLADPGRGYQEGTFQAPTARTAALRLTAVSGGRAALYDGLVLLEDRVETTVTFSIVTDLHRTVAVRTPSAPSAAIVGRADPSLGPEVRLGAAILALGYVGVLAGMWARGR